MSPKRDGIPAGPDATGQIFSALGRNSGRFLKKPASPLDNTSFFDIIERLVN
jgi:hypothetical protein